MKIRRVEKHYRVRHSGRRFVKFSVQRELRKDEMRPVYNTGEAKSKRALVA